MTDRKDGIGSNVTREGNNDVQKIYFIMLYDFLYDFFYGLW